MDNSMEDVYAFTKNHDRSDMQYPMRRGVDQLIRVNLLQGLWRDTLGFLLHPDIPQDVKRVADTGTATGLWLCALHNLKPSIEKLEGFDISSASFINARDLPSAVSLDILDATGPVPEALKGKFDLVHARLLAPAIVQGDPTRLISHVLDLLRPGGYVQWEEFDVSQIDLLIKDDVATPSKLEEVAKLIGASGSLLWIETLPQSLEARGMKVITTERKTVPSWQRSVMSYVICHVVREISYNHLDVNAPPGYGDTVRARVNAALEEVVNGSYAGYTFQCIVAQKPL